MAEPVSTTAMAIKAAPYVIAGMKAIGTIGSSYFGGKRDRRQQEENERATARAAMISALTGHRATARAAMISALTGQHATAQPQYVGSSGADAFNTLGNIGNIGLNILPFIQPQGNTDSYTTAGQTQDNPILMPNTDVVAKRHIAPPLTPRPNRIMGNIHNPIPQRLSGVGYSDPTRPYG